jgi:hypothetical protein
MQIFVRPPISGPTLVYTCSTKTTLAEFLQWVEDKTALSETYYYITYGGHPLAKSTDQQKQATFEELGIEKDTTILLNGRLCVKSASKKLSNAA